jgi:hypothetical protein
MSVPQTMEEMLDHLFEPYTMLRFNASDLCKVLGYVLDTLMMPYTPVSGTVINVLTGKAQGHEWIELGEGYTIIDYRLRDIFGDNDEVPHGIFEATAYPSFMFTVEKTLETEFHDQPTFRRLIDSVS